MSWSVSAIGKAPAVAAKIEKDFEQGSKCMEPEEGVRQAARAAIATCLKAQDADVAVKIDASGSQSTKYGPDGKPIGAMNFLRITVEPQYGFVE